MLYQLGYIPHHNQEEEETRFISELQNNIQWLIPVASPCSLAKPTLSMGRWIFFSNQPLNTRIRGGYCAHMCIDWTVGAEGQPATLSGRLLVYLLMLSSRTQKPWVSDDLGLCLSAAIVILNSRASNRPSHRPVKNGRVPFCFSPWQHVQMGACHLAIVLLSLLRDLPDLKPAVL